MNTFTGVASGSFTAPDHEYPSFVELELTAADSGGLTSTVSTTLNPKTVSLTFNTNPTGLQLTVGSTTQATPFTVTVIPGSSNSLSAPTPQALSGTSYTFASWSDGGAQTHVITAPAAAASYTASYNAGGPACADSFGNTCIAGPRTWLPADQTVLALAGDDNFQQITMPFPIQLYGQSYTTGWVDTNGVISFVAPNGSSWNHGAIPSAPAPNKPNAAVYPFWDDLDVDASASVRTALTGTAPNRQFIVEWRNVKFFVNNSARVSFEVVFSETGDIAVAWKDIDNTTLEQGGQATVGIENAAGTIALQYSLNQPNLRTGNGVLFRPPTSGAPSPVIDAPASSLTWAVGDTISFSGHATDPQDGTLPASALTWRVILHHCATPTSCHTHLMNTFTGVASGSFTAPDHEYPSFVELELTAADSGGLTSTVSTTLNPKTVSLTFNTNPTGLQLTVGSTTQATPFTVTVIPGSSNSLSAPTPQALSGTSYTFASWSDGGAPTHVITFVAPNGSSWNHGAIPSAPAPNKPNAAVYPFWDDLDVDASASVRTALTGTAPNRQFIVEWRNVKFFVNNSARVSFEVVFSETGDIAVAWKDIDNTTLEQGGQATVGIENAAGTIA